MGIWTVLSFTPQLVRLHRHETGNGRAIWDVDYSGQMSPDGNRLVNVLMNGKPAPEVRLAWGEALGSVWPDNYTRDAHKSEGSAGGGSEAMPSGGKLTQEQIHAENKKMFSADGCPLDLGDESGMDAFQMFLQGRDIQIAGGDESTDLKALKWFCKAAKAGSGLADFEIGEMYYSGFNLLSIRTPEMIYSNYIGLNMDTAMFWYLKAADHGNSAGMYKAGQLYRFGPQFKHYSHPADLSKAMPLLERAAALGDLEGLLALESVYEKGAQDSSRTISPDSGRVTAIKAKLALRVAEVEQNCLKMGPKIRSLTPERQIKGIVFGLAHSRSYSCTAVLEGEEEGDSVAEELAYVAQGKMLNGWNYTIYLSDDEKQQAPKRASTAEEFSRRATELAIIMSAVQNR